MARLLLFQREEEGKLEEYTVLTEEEDTDPEEFKRPGYTFKTEVAILDDVYQFPTDRCMDVGI